MFTYDENKFNCARSSETNGFGYGTNMLPRQTVGSQGIIVPSPIDTQGNNTITTVPTDTTSFDHIPGNTQFQHQPPNAFSDPYEQAICLKCLDVLPNMNGGLQTNQQSHRQVIHDTYHRVNQAPNILYTAQHNAHQNTTEYPTATHMDFNNGLTKPEESLNYSLHGTPVCTPASASAGTPINTPFNSSGALTPSDKPHVCTYNCGKAFDRKGDMKRHAQSHEPPRFRCVQEDCKYHAKGFTRKDKWTEHLKKHRKSL